MPSVGGAPSDETPDAGEGGSDQPDAALPEAALVPVEWVEREPLEVARSELGAAVLGDRIYLAGGFGDTSRFDAYQPLADEWVNLEPLPEPRDHAAIAAHDGAVYVFGGSATQTAWRYAPDDDEFTALADMTFARSSAVAISLGAHIYVVAGAGLAPTVLQRYEPETNEWELLAELSTLRDHSAAVLLDGKIYSLGGRENANIFHDSIEIYDPAQNEWQSGPAMQSVRSGFGAVAWRGHIIACGGEVDIDGEEQALDTCEALPPNGTEWETWPSLPQGAHGIGMANFEDRVFVLGGSTVFFTATNTDRAYELMFEPAE